MKVHYFSSLTNGRVSTVIEELKSVALFGQTPDGVEEPVETLAAGLARWPFFGSGSPESRFRSSLFLPDRCLRPHSCSPSIIGFNAFPTRSANIPLSPELPDRFSEQ